MSKSTWKLNFKNIRNRIFDSWTFYTIELQISLSISLICCHFCYILFFSLCTEFILCDSLHNQQYIHLSIIVTPNLEFIFFSLFCIPFKEGLHFTYSPNIPLASTPSIWDYDLSPLIVTNISSKSWNCPSSPSTISFQMHCRHYQVLFV